MMIVWGCNLLYVGKMVTFSFFQVIVYNHWLYIDYIATELSFFFFFFAW